MKMKVYTVISEIFDIPIDDISLESSPDTIENWDSLKHMNLILSLEDEFKIKFEDAQIMEMLSVRSIMEKIKILSSKLN